MGVGSWFGVHVVAPVGGAAGLGGMIAFGGLLQLSLSCGADRIGRYRCLDKFVLQGGNGFSLAGLVVLGVDFGGLCGFFACDRV